MNYFKKATQILPIILTFLTFLGLWGILLLLIRFFNLLPVKEKVVVSLRKTDILVGLIIYLKTSIDFAIFIGNAMHANPGWKKRIAIELGTAVGNAVGTLVILTVWIFFKQVPILIVTMIILASLVLLQMAQESFDLFYKKNSVSPVSYTVLFLSKQLKFINKISNKLFKYITLNLNILNVKSLSFFNLAVFSFSVPFILGLDDFAGYIPLFSIINVYGFAVGVFLGHMLLNLGLFLSPTKTTSLVRHPLILIIGGLAFVGIAFWGFWEALRILQLIVHFKIN